MSKGNKSKPPRKISIFTPVHEKRDDFLKAAYQSLNSQKMPEGWTWEWIILQNNGGGTLDARDKRIRSFDIGSCPDWIGFIKGEAVKRCTGELLLELDSDDQLLPGCLNEVIEAFADPEIGFVYSNSVHLWIDPLNGARGKVQRFEEKYGWKYREIDFEGVKLDEHISFAPAPEAIGRIWFAPNHLRAIRRTAYDSVGGYNPQIRTLDDGDLMCRLYLNTKFKHLSRPLYLYVVHGKNTWMRPDVNPEIQANVYTVYDRYIERMAERQAELWGLAKIELGGRFAVKQGYISVDLKDAHMNFDLNGKWNLDDSMVGVIRAYDILEHLYDPIHAMKEMYRVLAPGGIAFIQVPSTDGRGAFQDPTHKTFWNENSFWYYTKAEKAKYIDTPVRFQAVRIFTGPKNDEGCCWVTAHLVSLKNGYRPCGLVEI